jgi:hypothetical protein
MTGRRSAATTVLLSWRETVVNVAEASSDLPKLLRAAHDRNWPVTILRSPGEAAFKGATSDTVHPLLVSSELLADGNERAFDAVERLAERFSVWRAFVVEARPERSSARGSEPRSAGRTTRVIAKTRTSVARRADHRPAGRLSGFGPPVTSRWRCPDGTISKSR